MTSLLESVELDTLLIGAESSLNGPGNLGRNPNSCFLCSLINCWFVSLCFIKCRKEMNSSTVSWSVFFFFLRRTLTALQIILDILEILQRNLASALKVCNMEPKLCGLTNFMFSSKIHWSVLNLERIFSPTYDFLTACNNIH